MVARYCLLAGLVIWCLLKQVQLVSQVTALDGASQWDYMYIESKLPELNPVIEGGQERIVQYGFNVLIDARESTDPADGLSDVAIIPLVRFFIPFKANGLTRISGMSPFPILGVTKSPARKN